MKKIIIILLLLLTNVVSLQAQSSKILYSNALTHFYLTVYVNGDSTRFAISETSVPMKNMWRLSDQWETQVLYTFNETELSQFLSEVKDWMELAKIGDGFDWNNIINVSMQRISGFKCIVLCNKKSTVKFNTNKKSILGAIGGLHEFEVTRKTLAQ